MDTKQQAKPLPKVPGNKIIGSVYNLMKDPVGFLEVNMEKYDGAYRVGSIFKKVAIIDKPEYVKYILQDNNKNYTKSFGYEVLSLLLGNGLLTSEGDFWRKQRRLAQPAFHRDKLALLVDTMVDCTNDLIQELDTVAGQEVNLAKEMMSVTLNIVAKAMFSSDIKDMVKVVGHEIDIANELAVKKINNPIQLPMWVPTPGHIKEQKSIKVLDDIIMGIIEERRASTEKHDDLLQMLMDVKDEDTGEQMSDRQLRDECMTIFLAGHETTALALSWGWYLLDQNPEEREKLFTEVDTVLQGRTPQLADLPNLPYTKLLVDEILRIYPPAWVIGRRPIEDDVVGGHTIEAGTNILMPVYHIHHNKEIWGDPNVFRPERFSKEEMKDKHRYAYFPFGGGPRLCIGNNFALMEMQLVIAMLAQHYKFDLRKGYKAELDPLITLRPKGANMPMTVVKR